MINVIQCQLFPASPIPKATLRLIPFTLMTFLWFVSRFVGEPGKCAEARQVFMRKNAPCGLLSFIKGPVPNMCNLLLDNGFDKRYLVGKGIRHVRSTVGPLVHYKRAMAMPCRGTSPS